MSYAITRLHSSGLLATIQDDEVWSKNPANKFIKFNKFIVNLNLSGVVQEPGRLRRARAAVRRHQPDPDRRQLPAPRRRHGAPPPPAAHRRARCRSLRRGSGRRPSDPGPGSEPERAGGRAPSVTAAIDPGAGPRPRRPG